ncbi:hypothetical protein B0H14DRAFT_2580110 [Mycena olivaceomarginata]|nr:hypothetical protein B0H14DRAFT_2580110 [Mycena olivaceomarginata]
METGKRLLGPEKLSFCIPFENRATSEQDMSKTQPRPSARPPCTATTSISSAQPDRDHYSRLAQILVFWMLDDEHIRVNVRRKGFKFRIIVSKIPPRSNWISILFAANTGLAQGVQNNDFPSLTWSTILISY